MMKENNPNFGNMNHPHYNNSCNFNYYWLLYAVIIQLIIIFQLFMNKDFDDDDFEENFTELKENITIGTAQRRGRKCFTQVKNIPDIFDYERMIKFWKKVISYSYT